MLTNAAVMDDALYAGGWQRGMNRIPLSGGQPTFLPMADEVTAIVAWNGRLLAE